MFRVLFMILSATENCNAAHSSNISHYGFLDNNCLLNSVNVLEIFQSFLYSIYLIFEL